MDDRMRLGSNRKDLESPCRFCTKPEKRPGCHDHCDDYFEFKNQLERVKKYHEEHKGTIYDPLAPKYRRDL